MKNVHINVEVICEGEDETIHSTRQSFPSRQGVQEWIDDCVRGVHDEQQTERRIEERGNDIMFSSQVDEDNYISRHI